MSDNPERATRAAGVTRPNLTDSGNAAVKVIPDGDVQTNPAVERGAGRLAEALEARGASVRVVLLPAVVAA